MQPVLFVCRYSLSALVFGLFAVGLRAAPAPGLSPDVAVCTVSVPGYSLDPFVIAAGGAAQVSQEISPDAGVAVFTVTNQPASDQDRAAMETILKRGGSVILSLAGSEKNIYSLDKISPVNFWSVESTATSA